MRCAIPRGENGGHEKLWGDSPWEVKCVGARASISASAPFRTFQYRATIRLSLQPPSPNNHRLHHREARQQPARIYPTTPFDPLLEYGFRDTGFSSRLSSWRRRGGGSSDLLACSTGASGLDRGEEDHPADFINSDHRINENISFLLFCYIHPSRGFRNAIFDQSGRLRTR